MKSIRRPCLAPLHHSVDIITASLIHNTTQQSSFFSLHLLTFIEPFPPKSFTMKFTLSVIVQLALCASALAAPAPQASGAPNANVPPSTTVDLTGQKVIPLPVTPTSLPRLLTTVSLREPTESSPSRRRPRTRPPRRCRSAWPRSWWWPASPPSRAPPS